MKRPSALLWVPLIWGISLFLSLTALAPQVTVQDEGGELVQSFTLFLGDSFETEYVHSVQLCPVIDRYYGTKGSLWLWEERTQSTNAGLPTEAPFRGRFLHDGAWYRYIGGGRPHDDIYLRVGDDRLGVNTLTLPSGKVVKLFETFPGSRLTIRAN